MPAEHAPLLRRRHWVVLLLCVLSVVALVCTHLQTVETLQSGFRIPADLDMNQANYSQSLL